MPRLPVDHACLKLMQIRKETIMHIRQLLGHLGAAGALIASSAVFAHQNVPAATSVAAGMMVKDSSGGDVGTVQSLDGEFLIVATDRHQVRLPRSSFTPHEGHLLIATTRAELNAQVDKALAEAAAQITVGAAVRGAGGSLVGTIEELEEEFVTLKLSSGELVRLPRNGIAAGPDGAVIGMTGAELRAAAGQASSD